MRGGVSNVDIDRKNTLQINQQIADTAAQYEKLSYAELSKLLFDRGIHQSMESTTGASKPVNPGTLKKWLDRARTQGLL